MGKKKKRFIKKVGVATKSEINKSMIINNTTILEWSKEKRNQAIRETVKAAIVIAFILLIFGVIGSMEIGVL